MSVFFLDVYCIFYFILCLEYVLCLRLFVAVYKFVVWFSISSPWILFQILHPSNIYM